MGIEDADAYGYAELLPSRVVKHMRDSDKRKSGADEEVKQSGKPPLGCQHGAWMK